MKKILLVVLLGLFVVEARDEMMFFSIQDALNDPKAKSAIMNDIEISFGRSEKNEQRQSKIVTTSKRTSLGVRGAENACRWALYSAIKQLQVSAMREGYTKVVDIVSNWKHISYDSQDKFQCAVGNMMVGVALKGELVQ